jgi:PAS domain S-box-containing protein
VLACWIGATDWVALRVVDGGAEGLLVQPWVESAALGEERSIDLDVDALAPVPDDDVPLGRALVEGQAHCGTLSGRGLAGMPAWSWRSAQVRRAAVLPVCLGLRSLAALEFHDPGEALVDGGVLAACFELIALQLAQAAQREEAQRASLAHAEQYGRLAMLASRTARHAVITDAEGTIEWVHPALAQTTGYGTIDLRGRPLWEVLVRDADDLRPAAQLRERFQAGAAFRLEFMARRGAVCLAPEEVYWLEVDAQVVYDPASGRLQFLCLCQDVSERVQHRLGMDEGREILAALTDNLPISLVALDARSLAVISLNRHAEEEFGVEADGLGRGAGDPGSAAASPTGRDLDREPVPVLGPGLAELIAPQLREAVGGAAPVEHEFAWSSPRGERIVAARHVAVGRMHGAPRIVISQLRDVTQLRRSEQILRESEQRYRELVESIEEGVFVTDPRSDTHHYLSPRVLDMLGVDAYDVHLGGLLEPRVEPEDLPLLQAQRALELRQTPSDVTLRVRHPVRGLRWIRRRTRTRPLPNGDLRVYGLLDDVTDQREHALQLQAAHDAAEAASQAKGRFLATMSHEIRTPMNGILGMTELLLGTELSERQRRFAQAVYRSGEGLLEILNDVLDFAKIEAGRLELQRGVVNLRQLVDDTLELLAPRAHAKGLALSLHVAPGVPERILADGLRLRQVITNLLSNAIKFTERGEVAVRLDCEAPAGDDLPWRLGCAVRDTGIGIAPRDLSQLFQAFTQAHDGVARRYGGTGLGLAISQQLVELMGGGFQVDSRPGEGSVFRFTFEAGRVDGEAAGDPVAADAPRAVSPLAPWRDRRALVATAHPASRQALADLLQAWGLVVEQAEDEAGLRRQLASAVTELPRWALVLIDRDLPGAGGVELLHALRRDARLAGTQWLLMSDLSAAGEPPPALLGSGVRLLHQPVRRDELHAALADLPGQVSPPLPAVPRLALRALVVEDHPVNQEVMAQMLRRCGAEVDIAASGQAGLQALREQRYDLVLMDIQMPELDGIQALRRWRAMAAAGERLATGPDTPVIAVTAHALGRDAQQLLDEGFCAHLPKPFRFAELLQLLLRLLPDAAAGLSTGAAASMEGERFDEGFGEGFPLLDPAALQRLRRLDPQGQNRLMERVMAAFEASLDRVLTQVGPLRAQGDAQGLHALVHTLKSAAGHVGALALAGLCQRCEPQLRAGRLPQAIDGDLDDLLAEVRRLKAGLRCPGAQTVEVETMVAAG